MRGLAVILSLLVVPGNLCADDWRQFRGNDSSGVSSAPNLPAKLDDAKALRWKVPLPGRGLSGPIVIGDRVFLTASSGYRDDRLHVLCFSCATGDQLWDRQFRATGRTVCHEVMCMATPQACSDGERIYAYYSCNDVICLDLDGRTGTSFGIADWDSIIPTRAARSGCLRHPLWWMKRSWCSWIPTASRSRPG
jgi:hypothetical protein